MNFNCPRAIVSSVMQESAFYIVKLCVNYQAAAVFQNTFFNICFIQTCESGQKQQHVILSFLKIEIKHFIDFILLSYW